MTDKNTTFVLKKIKIKNKNHHGGAWKVAYADFVTAMMAFFLLLWLLNVVSSPTLQALSDYFSTSPTNGPSGSGGILSGNTANTPGSADTPMRQNIVSKIETITTPSTKSTLSSNTQTKQPISKGEIKELSNMQKTITHIIKVLPLKIRTLFPSITVYKEENGESVRIVHDDQKPIFYPKSDKLTLEGIRIFQIMAVYIKKIPYKISVTGFLDTMLPKQAPESDWNLAILRANTIILFLEKRGIPSSRFYAIEARQNKPPIMNQVLLFFRGTPKNNNLDNISSDNEITPPAL